MKKEVAFLEAVKPLFQQLRTSLPRTFAVFRRSLRIEKAARVLRLVEVIAQPVAILLDPEIHVLLGGINLWSELFEVFFSSSAISCAAPLISAWDSGAEPVCTFEKVMETIHHRRPRARRLPLVSSSMRVISLRFLTRLFEQPFMHFASFTEIVNVVACQHKIAEQIR